MNSDAWLYLFAALVAVSLLFVGVFYLTQIGDFNVGWLDPTEICDIVNQLIPLEITAHAFLTLVFLAFGKWISLLINLPLVVYNANLYIHNRHLIRLLTRRRGKSRFLGANFHALDDYNKRVLAKIIFFVVSFFYYLYRILYALIEEDSLNRRP